MFDVIEILNLKKKHTHTHTHSKKKSLMIFSLIIFGLFIEKKSG